MENGLPRTGTSSESLVWMLRAARILPRSAKKETVESICTYEYGVQSTCFWSNAAWSSNICVSYSCITQCFFCLVEKAQSDWAASQRRSTLACAPWQSLAWVTSFFARASSRYMECRGSAKVAGVCDTIGCILTMPSPFSWKTSARRSKSI